MTEEILGEKSREIAQLTLVPGDGGRFEVKIDDKLVFSKLQESRFPEYEEISRHL